MRKMKPIVFMKNRSFEVSICFLRMYQFGLNWPWPKLGLIYSRKFSIPGNGNENFFLRKKGLFFLRIATFYSFFSRLKYCLRNNKAFRESLPKRLRILVEKSPVSKFQPLCTGGQNLRSEFWLEIKIILTKLTSGNTKMASEV